MHPLTQNNVRLWKNQNMDFEDTIYIFVQYTLIIFTLS